MVTEPAIVCVPVGLAVTVPAIVTVLPTVTVPEMAGRELTVTVVLARVTPWVGTMAKETGCVTGKLEIDAAENVTACVAGKFPTVTVPVMAAPTVTVTFSRADRLLASSATVTVFITVTELATALLITALVRVTTVGVSEIAR
jgi:hypothetical protein